MTKKRKRKKPYPFKTGLANKSFWEEFLEDIWMEIND